MYAGNLQPCKRDAKIRTRCKTLSNGENLAPKIGNLAFGGWRKLSAQCFLGEKWCKIERFQLRALAQFSRQVWAAGDEIIDLRSRARDNNFAAAVLCGVCSRRKDANKLQPLKWPRAPSAPGGEARPAHLHVHSVHTAMVICLCKRASRERPHTHTQRELQTASISRRCGKIFTEQHAIGNYEAETLTFVTFPPTLWHISFLFLSVFKKICWQKNSFAT